MNMIGVKNPEKYLIYFTALVLFILQSLYFARNNKFEYPPDEIRHLSYICHLKTTHQFFPDYENFHIYSRSGKESKRPNKLAHPPFYYHLMKFFAPENPADIMRSFRELRYINIIISSIGIIICFFIGFRLDLSLSFHILYSLSLISVPMLSYLAGAVNNDNLAFVGGSISLLGGIYLLEDRKIAFYLLGIGILISLLTKATAGIQVMIFLIIIMGYWIWSDKRFNFSIHMIFLIFSIFLPILYYILVKLQYGTFFPSGQGSINIPSQYLKTVEYINHFFFRLWHSFTGIHSHHSIGKYSIFANYPYLIVLILAIFALFFIRKRSLLLKINKNIFSVVKIGFISLILFMIVHFIEVYTTHLRTGYPGGIQARYYFPLVSSVFIIAYLPFGKSKRLSIFTFLFALIILLGFLYTNFYYFLFIY